jgi:hypothetical protein
MVSAKLTSSCNSAQCSPIYRKVFAKLTAKITEKIYANLYAKLLVLIIDYYEVKTDTPCFEETRGVRKRGVPFRGIFDIVFDHTVEVEVPLACRPGRQHIVGTDAPTHSLLPGLPHLRSLRLATYRADPGAYAGFPPFRKRASRST